MSTTKRTGNEEMMEEVEVGTATEVRTDAEEAEEVIESAVQIDLHRTKTVSSGKTYFNYYVPVTAFGHEMKIEIRPKANSDGKVDPVSYERLALIFDVTREETGKDEYHLIAQRMTMRGNDGKKVTYMTYEVTKTDPITGMSLSVGVVPYGDSNKRMLLSLFEQKSKF